MATYAYTQLHNPTTDIRVLQLWPATWEEEIKVSLSIHELSVAPPYTALSYSWGDATPTSTIHIYDKHGNAEGTLPLHSNLDHALRALRCAESACQVWTDYICINQSKKSEREKQVLLMAAIYKKASKVKVYLGVPDKYTKRAFDLMDRIYNAQYSVDPSLPGIHQPRAWLPLKMLLTRPWFRRKWVIQEVVVAKDVVVLCADQRETYLTQWDRLQAATSQRLVGPLYDYKAVMPNIEASHQLQLALINLTNIANTRSLPESSDHRPTIIELAYTYQLASATDPRDHLFALLSMASDGHLLELEPKYEDNTAQENCERFAKYFLRQDCSLSILYRAGLHARPAGDKSSRIQPDHGHAYGAPSWVPNWCGSRTPTSIDHLLGIWSPERRPSFYNVAPGRKKELTRISDKGILGIKGIIIDKIQHLSEGHVSPYSQYFDKNEYLEAQQQYFVNTLNLAEKHLTKKCYPQALDVDDVLWRTLICDVSPTGQEAPGHYREDFAGWRRFHINPSTAGWDETASRSRERYLDAINAHNINRVFGITKDGYAGMFPSVTTVGDCIAVLFGGEFPFVLRKCDELSHYQLVGQCYVQGLMRGGNFEDRPEEEIVLGGQFEVAELPISDSPGKPS